ncbi:alpha/beta hydrolase [Pseudonocardiaceae bacterium YIM PH 21723]|nr:alpha/beta hydrolase [Pseudonocardiaceae bacterium YIM PH 21723]
MSIDIIQISTESGTFEARAAGPEDGRPVILLHGFPQTSLQWEHQLEALGAQGFRAVAPDQRGYTPGVRPAEIADYAMPHLVEDVLRIADSLGWQEFDLVGHDWGCAVAWTTAITAPDRIRRLVPISIPHPAAFGQALLNDPQQQANSAYFQLFRQPTPIPEDAILGGAFTKFQLPEAHAQYYFERMSEPGVLTAMLNWYRAMGSMAETDECTVPTLFIASTDDTAVALSGIENTGKFVTADYRLEVIQGGSHWLTEEHAETVSSLILEHLGD